MILNIIWTFEKQNVFEVEWIKEIFSRFEIVESIDAGLNFDYEYDNSLIIIQDIKDNSKFENYLNRLLTKKLNFRILHISDEALNHNIQFYNNFGDKVIRMIYSEDYSKRFNVFTIPVGYKPGVKKIEVEKKYLINFVGQIKSDRQQMLSVFSYLEPKFIRLTNQWNDPQGLSTEDYSKILSQSHFTLCPAGWVSVDSFRINEAMECGSIPVSILYGGKNYFESVYGENPFILGNNWQETIELIKSTNIEEKKQEVEIWWKNFKDKLKDKIYEFFSKK